MEIKREMNLFSSFNVSILGQDFLTWSKRAVLISLNPSSIAITNVAHHLFLKRCQPYNTSKFFHFVGSLKTYPFHLLIYGAQFIKIISHYKKIGYNINVLQQTACLVVNPITLATLLSSLIARRWVGLQTLWCFRLKDLSIEEMVGA